MEQLRFQVASDKLQTYTANGFSTKKPSAGKYFSSIWVFPESEDQLFRWYGTLPRTLVERLVIMYVQSESHILDPFMGLGTTLDVAARAHVDATGIDNNPLACLATETLLYGIPRLSLNAIAARIARNLGGLIRDRTMHRSQWRDIVEEESYSYTRKWFRKDTLDSVLGLLFQIADVQDIRVQRLLFLIASQVAKEVASIDPRCTHHLVTKKKPFIDPISLLREKMKRGFGALYDKPPIVSRISIRQESVFQSKLEKNSYDFVLAHPPYLGVIHYHLIHRLATDLLDIVNRVGSPDSIKHLDFSYEKIKSSDVSTDNSERYSSFIKDFAAFMSTVIVPEGRCIVVIGDQRHRKHLRHPFTEFIQELELNGFMLEDIAIWILQNNAGMHVLRRGNFIDHNYVLVFHNQK